MSLLQNFDTGIHRAIARNILVSKQKETIWDKLLEQIRNPLIALLLFSALISFLMGQWDDAVSIGLVVFLLTFFFSYFTVSHACVGHQRR